jgi:hypothetical protein
MSRVANSKKKKAAYGTSMGVSSIIAILVILVLVVFSALSITTAKADLTLSNKTSDSVKAFYVADSGAEETIAGVVAQLAGGDEFTPDKNTQDFSLEPASGGNLLSFTRTIDKERNLEVSVLITSDGQIHRQLWQVVPSSEWEADEDIKLFQ